MGNSAFDLADNLPAIPVQTGGTESLGFQFQQLNDGQSNGVQLLDLVCDQITLTLIPTRGMGIWKANHAGVRFGWDSPVQGPVHPAWVPISEPGGLGWLDGFDEMMVRCGLQNNGAPEFDEQGTLVWPLHGRIANLPASGTQVEIDTDERKITARATVHEHRFHFCRWELNTEISLTSGSDELSIVDTVTNRSDRNCSFQMLYHNNFGSPILQPGSKIFAAAKRVAPRNDHAAKDISSWNQFGDPDPTYAEQVYFCDLESDHGEATVLLANADDSAGVSIRYQVEHLPCFSVWKNTVGHNDGYVCGLEPATNFPNPRSFEARHGRVVEVEPGQSVRLQYKIGLHVSSERVDQVRQEIEAVSPESPDICTAPLKDWSAP